MRLSKHERTIARSLTQAWCHIEQSHPRPTRRYLSSTSRPDVAVVGGGITGLAAAYSLAVEGANVTLYEASNSLGGWIQSRHVDLPDGRVVFERGPRTLRYSPSNGALTAAWIGGLGLEDDMLWTSKTDPAARSRFIYYPDHLVEVPGVGVIRSLATLFFEPLFKGAIGAILREPTRPPRSEDVQDESVGSFVSRRVGQDFANKVVSAIFHGIYAGDIWQLSAASLLPAPWAAEQKMGSLLRGLELIRNGHRIEDFHYPKQLRDGLSLSMREKVMNASFYTFRHGLQQLVDAAESKLRDLPNVEIIKNKRLGSVSLSSSPQSDLTTHNQRVTLTLQSNNAVPNSAERHHTSLHNADYDQVVSTLSSSLNQSLFFDGHDKYDIPSVTVAVVSLFFSHTQKNQIPTLRGFGYLIPQAVPFEQNPELALGVIFDSCAVRGQDTAAGMKLTVMLGGHYWDGWRQYPSADDCLAMARGVLERHLGITATPAAFDVQINQNCIPQYRVGHRQRLAEKHKRLLKKFGGRVKVAGSSYSGVGVNDCVRAGMNIGVAATSQGWREKTGLESFAKEPNWMLINVVGNGPRPKK